MIGRVAGTTSLLLMLTTAASGQSGLGITVVPQAGWFASDQHLFRLSPEPGSGANPDFIQMTPGAVVGLGIELDLPVPILGLRADGLYTIGSDVSRKATVQSDPDCIEQCGRRDVLRSLGGGGLLVGSLDLVLRAPWVGIARPYALIGGGVERYDFPQESLDEGMEEMARDVTVRALHLGIGADAAVGPLRIAITASDYLSTYPSPHPGADPDGGDDFTQHSLIVTLGLSVSLP